MKIAIVQPYAMGPGHYDAYTKRFCQGICQFNEEIHLITATGTRDNWDSEISVKSVKTLKEGSFMAASFEKDKNSPMFLRRIRFFYTSWIVQWKAIRYFKKNRLDVIHFIDSELFSLSLIFFILGKPKKVFVTVPGILSIPNIKNPLKYLYSLARNFAARKLLKFAIPIVHSEPVRDFLISSKIFLEKDIPVILWGIDEPMCAYDKRVAREKLNIFYSGKIFGFFGYILPQKGFRFLLDALPVFENCAVLSVVHSDKSSDEEFVKKIIKENKNKNFFLKFDFVSEKDLALHIISCDALLLPYKKDFAGESGIMSLSLSYKKPIIAANVGKIGGLVKEKKLGIIFEAESKDSLKRAVDKFINLDERELYSIEKNIENYVRENSWREVARKHLIVYGNKEK